MKKLIVFLAILLLMLSCQKETRPNIIFIMSDEELKKLIKVGDKVIFGKFAGEEIKHNGEKHLIISRDSILGKIVD